jgi:uncharacterized membrane protein (DUF441 family)
MLEQLQQLWPVLNGSHGIIAAIVAWRGFIGVTVPLVNSWLQMKATELLVASPRIANDIVQKKWYQTIGLILRMTIGVMLPSQSSVLVHQVNVSAQMGNTETFDKAEIKP